MENIRSALQARSSSKRTQPVYFVTVAVDDRVIPLAFFHLKKNEGTLDTSSLRAIGARLETSSGTSAFEAPWNVIIGRHMSREESNSDALNEFMSAVLAVDRISYAMTHQRDIAPKIVTNKYRFTVPKLSDLEAWTPPPPPKLNWKECHCGCNCDVLMIGSIQFSHDRLGTLRIGHGTVGRVLGIFSTKASLEAEILRETRDERVAMLKALRSTGDIR
jgi:hypothetical protein